MYDSYPQHDVPQIHLIQRFFSQRWSAIVIEILMTIVITVAAGQAFDIFDPLHKSVEADQPALAQTVRSADLLRRGVGVPLWQLEQRARQHIESGRYAEAAPWLELLAFAKPEWLVPSWYLEIAQFYATLGEKKQAAIHFERYFELIGKSAANVAQSG